MKLQYIFAALLCLCLLIAPAAAAGGSGTAASPYIIETPAELQSIQNNLAAYYRLANNINLQGVSFTPIGSTSTPFIGSFDGAGHIISNMVISTTTQSTGFFRCIGPGATIKDVTFQDCTVSSTTLRTGTVFGSIIMSTANHDLATIDNIDCVRCALQSSSFVGVIGGSINTAAVVDVIDCDVSYSSVEATSETGITGVIAHVSSASHVEFIRGSVSESRFKSAGLYTGVISAIGGASYVGMTDTEIADCIFEGGSNYVGTIGSVNGAASVSLNGVDVRNCVMKATDYVGGIVGFVDKDNTNNIGTHVSATDCSVTDCTIYATSSYAGGLSGCINSISTGVFDGCAVTGCTILANTYAAGVCPAYS